MSPTYKSFSFFFFFNLNMCLGSILFGYFLTVYNPLQTQIDYLNDWLDDSTKSTYEGILSAVIPFGAAIGALISPFLLHKLGRKKTCIFSDILCAIGSGLSLIEGFYPLFFGRLICGIYIGINSNLVPIYIREISPIELSDYLGTLVNLMLNFGIVLAFLFGLNTISENNLKDGGQDNWWRFMFGFPIISLLRTILLLTIFNYESPFFLLVQNKEIECHKLINKLFKEEFVEDIYTTLKIRVENFKHKREPSLIKEIISKRYSIRFIVSLCMVFVCQFSGINAVGFYSKQLFTKFAGSDTQANYFNGGYSALGLIISLFLGFFVRHLGIKKSYMLSLVLVGISLILLSIFSYLNIYLGCLICLFSFIFSFNLGAGSIIFIVVPQILPEKLIGVIFLFYWIFAFLVGLLFPKMIQSNMGVEGSFLLFGICVFIGLIVVSFLMKETKGKNHDEISTLYSKLIDTEYPVEINDEIDENFN